MRSIVRSEMNERIKDDLEKSMIVKLTFSINQNESQPTWTEDGKEFNYKDEMYDVVKTETKDDRITYFCIKDKDEKELNLALEDLIKKNQSNNKKDKNNPQKELSKYDIALNKKQNKTELKVPFQIFLPNFYKSLNLQVNSPPPKLV